ncbi:MAG: ribonuclease HI family protein [bacterium]|nr:ribonuclease HI family protein [bacterium]
MEAVAYVDGASLANPGCAALAVRLYDTQGQLLQSICEPIGKQTNNFAEYYALLRCLQEAYQMGITRLTIYTDSELLVKQWIREYEVRSDNLRPLYQEAQEFRERFKPLKILYARKDSLNLAKVVDRMAREAAKHVQQFAPILDEEENSE